ncbi:MAG: zinc-ribbon domain-containing protein [Myxococcota bacterium]
MIAACPRCSARYRVDPARVGPQGARLRCAKCEAVFRVRAPELATPATPGVVETTRPDPPTPTPAPAPAPARADRAPSRAEVPPSADERGVERDRLVLIADADVDEGKRTAAAVAALGLQPILVHDGVEAMLTIQRMLPRAVVLDAALPKMFGFQVCEVVKRNDALRDTHVVLIGAIHHRDRYRRPPSELYGADVYLERPDVPDGLEDVLRRFGLAVRAPDAPSPVAAPAPRAVREPAPAPAPAPRPKPARSAPEPVARPAAAAASVSDELAAERAKAERLARIIVSDIVLYNAEKFDEAVRGGGDVVAAMESVLADGRDLFRQRIDERVRNERDYLDDELQRVARERSGR